MYGGVPREVYQGGCTVWYIPPWYTRVVYSSVFLPGWCITQSPYYPGGICAPYRHLVVYVHPTGTWWYIRLPTPGWYIHLLTPGW